MDSAARAFFEQLVEAPGPSGYERPIQDVVRRYAGQFAQDVFTDVHGNVLAGVHVDRPRKFMLAGHCDQIGLIVTQIDSDGFLYAQPIGGWDPMQLVGQNMTIWTQQGAVPAVISRKPIHLQTEDERKQVIKLRELWLDIGASSKEDAASVVRIGDPVTLELGMRQLRNQLVCGPGMDNRTGVWVVVEALRRVTRLEPKWAVFAVSTVQEEIGLRGVRTSAYRLDPEAGIAVDVTHATDCPTIDRRQEGEVLLGRGPVIYRGPNMNPILTQRLIGAADAQEIPYQLSAIGRATPNDANTLQIARQGVATGLVSIPNRYMHSAVETVSVADLDHAADLLAATVVDLAGDEDFTP